ncbi:MAG: hypothetical protein Q9160_008464 [Pyrenula sp. 1 TL-2023]
MPSERHEALYSNPHSHSAPLRSHSKKHHSLPASASAPKPVATAAAVAPPPTQQPSLSPRKDTKDLNKKYQMANQSAKVPSSQTSQRASYPPATREAHPHSNSHAAAAPAPAPATAKQRSAAKRTVQSVMAGKEPPPASAPAPAQAPAVVAERQPPNRPPLNGGVDDDDRRVSASYLMKLGILLNVEALFKVSPDEVADLMADLGRTYPDLLEGAGLQRLEGRR